MKITFYHNTAEIVRLDKTNFLKDELIISGTLRDNCSKIYPIITVEMPHSETVFDYNYCYIDFFKRYYYIDDVVCLRTGLYQLSMSCDSLMSWKPEILNLDVFALRNEYNYSGQIIDDELPALCGTNIEVDTVHSIDNVIQSNPNKYCCILYIGSINYDFITDNNNKFVDAVSGVTATSVCYLTTPIILNAILRGIANTDLVDFKNMFANEPASSVINIIIYPIDLLELYNNEYIRPDENPIKEYTRTESGSKWVISFGGATIRIPSEYLGDYTNDKLYMIRGFQNSNIVHFYYKYTDMETYLLNNNTYFMNFEPYTKCKLFLPFYGIIDIDSKIIYHDIFIKYSLDVLTGKLYIKVSGINIDGGGAIEYYFEGTIGHNVPVTGSNANEKTRNLVLSTLSTVANIASGGFINNVVDIPSSSTTVSRYSYSRDNKRLTSVKSETTTTPQKSHKELNIPALVNTVTKSSVNLMSGMNTSFTTGTIGGDMCSWEDNVNCHLYISRVKFYIPNNYSKLVGYPSKYSGKLSGLNGFTLIGGVRIKGIPAMQEELENIEQILKSGIILPDPVSN